MSQALSLRGKQGRTGGAYTHGDLVLIEDDVVGEASVVHPGHGLAGLDGHGGRLEHQGTAVSASLDGGVGVGSQGQGQGGHSHTSELGDLLQVAQVTTRGTPKSTTLVKPGWSRPAADE